MKNTPDIKKIISELVYEQSLVIGSDLARSRATASGEITFKSNNIDDISLKDTNPEILDHLISSYEELFGKASVEVCLNVLRRYNKEDINKLLPKNIVSSL